MDIPEVLFDEDVDNFVSALARRPVGEDKYLVSNDVDGIVKFIRGYPGMDYELTYISDGVSQLLCLNPIFKSCSCIGSILRLREDPQWEKVVMELLKKCPEIKGVEIGDGVSSPTDKVLRSYFNTYLKILRECNLLYFSVKCKTIKARCKIDRRIDRVMRKNYSTVYLEGSFGTNIENRIIGKLARNMKLRLLARNRAVFCLVCIWWLVWRKRWTLWPLDVMKMIVGMCSKPRCLKKKTHFNTSSIPIRSTCLEEWVDVAVELGRSLY